MCAAVGHHGAMDGWPAERRFDSWRDLSSALIAADVAGWIFRGQPSAALPLTTKLERDLAAIDRSWWSDMENSLLAHFQDRARAHLPDVPAAADLLGWWSLMQHYGAPTRLLDWTASPFVALYFALAQPHDDEEVALWCFAAAPLRNSFGRTSPSGVDHLGTKHVTTVKNGEVVEDGYPYSGIDWHEVENEQLRRVVRDEVGLPYPVMPARLDARMLAQQTVLTCDGALNGGIPFPLALREYRDPAGGTVGWPRLLKKVRLSVSMRKSGLVSLLSMGITADSLFPGLDGIGEATALRARADLPATMRDVLEGRGPWTR